MAYPDIFENNQVGEFADPQSAGAYFFFPVAIENEIIDVDELNPSNPQDAALAVRNGQIPTQAGTIELSPSELAAYDLVSAKKRGDDLIIGPSPKSGVDKESRLIYASGLLTLSYESGIVKVVAEAVPPKRAIWSPDYAKIGARAFRFLGIHAPVYDITDLQSDETVLSPIKRVH